MNMLTIIDREHVFPEDSTNSQDVRAKERANLEFNYGLGESGMMGTPLLGLGESGMIGTPLFGLGESGMIGTPLFGLGESGMMGTPLLGLGESGIMEHRSRRKSRYSLLRSQGWL